MADTNVGLTVQLHDGTSTYTDIAEVTDVSGLGLTVDVTETTHYSSTSGYKTRLPTLLDLKPITLQVNFLRTGATHDGTTGLLYVAKGKLARQFKIRTPAAATLWEMTCYVTDVTINPPIGGQVTGSFTLTPTGAPITTP
ncbi:MAG: hypothetical protein HY825_13595 [Acidobacteria bacterium]|nr:hypothetical protein [Acidobacteriota bacterium]